MIKGYIISCVTHMKNPFAVFRQKKKKKRLITIKGSAENQFFPLSRPVPGSAGRTSGAHRAPRLQWRGGPARRRCPPAQRRRREPRAGPGAAAGRAGKPARREAGVARWVGARLWDTSSYSCVRHLNAARSSRHLTGAAVGPGRGTGPGSARRARGAGRHRRGSVPTNAPRCAGGTRTARAQGWCHLPPVTPAPWEASL